MPISFIARLKAVIGLTEPEIAALQSLAAKPVVVEPGTALLKEGQTTGADQGLGILLLSGWAVRSRTFSDGRRQVIRFLIAGDLCDPVFFVPRQALHSIETLTQASVALFRPEDLLAILERWPRIAVGLWWLAGHEQAVLQERVATLGQHDAYERLIGLLWELWRRHALAGQILDHSFRFPLTQEILGEALGLSTVHVNRTLRRLRQEGLIETPDRKLVIRDPEQLRRLAERSDEGLILNGPSDYLLKVAYSARAT